MADTPSRHRGFSPPLIRTDERLVEGTTFLVCVVWDLDFRASCFVHRDQPDCENALVLGRFIANTSGKVKSLYDGTREGKTY